MTQALLMTTARPRGVPRRLQRQTTTRMEGPLNVPRLPATSTTCSPTRTEPSATPCASSPSASSLPTSPSGTTRARCPTASARSSARSGCSGMHLKGYGCAGRARRRTAWPAASWRRSTPGCAASVSVQGSLAMYAIHRWGSEEHKEEWLPRMATGEAIGCFGLTESDAGSDPGSMRTRATPRWRRLGAQRLEDVDHQRHARRRSRSSGRRPRTASGGSSSPPTRRASPPQDPAQAVAARLGDRRAVVRRPPAAGRRGLPRGARAQGPADAVSTRPGSASSGARSERPGPAWRRRSTTPGSAASSASRWRRSSSPSASSP